MATKQFATTIKQLKSAVPAMIPLTVTPALAQVLLDNMRSNRQLRRAFVAQLARMMAQGRWDEDVPQPIGFDLQGKLCDGQHRLAAVIASGRTITFWAALGIKNATVNVMDGGITRSLADRFKAFTSNKPIHRIVQGNNRRAKGLSAITNSFFRMFIGKQGGFDVKLSFDEAVRIVELFEDACCWTIDAFGSGRHTERAACLSAFAAARYWATVQGDEHVEQLCKLVNPIIKGEGLHGNALLMYRYLIMLRSKTAQKAYNDTQWEQTMKMLALLRGQLTGEHRRVIRVPAKTAQLVAWYFGDVDEVLELIGYVKPNGAAR